MNDEIKRLTDLVNNPVTVNYSGAIRLYDEVEKYLSNWKNADLSGLQQRLQQSIEARGILKRILVTQTEVLTDNQKTDITNYLELFESLINALTTKIEYRKNKPETLDNTEQLKDLLQKHFPNAGNPQFESLIEHITAVKRPMYVPTLKLETSKNALYDTLKEIRINLGYDRKHLADVFEKCCKLNYEIIYKQI